MGKSDTHQNLTLRVPTDLHSTATAIAKQAGVSLTGYILQAVRDAVARELVIPPETTDEQAAFELHLQFAVAGHEPDQRAYRVVDGITNLAGLSGATELSARLTRIVTMQPRS